jgi:DNA-binding transcriptional MerR regulator
MALYTIGEVAQLCDINPVTLRAWQRRYGLLKPQRTDGGHRLFNEQEIDRIREIKRWIDSGVQVSKVKTLLNDNTVEKKTAGGNSRRFCWGISTTAATPFAAVDQRAQP